MIIQERNEDLIKACKIASEARDYGCSLIKPGAKLLEVTEKIEAKIVELGGKFAFPPQISLNHVAAHYCPDVEDTIIFTDQVCKVDIGVHINGYIGDTAATVDLSGKYKKLVDASKAAVENACKAAKPGTALSAIGKIIQDTIQSYGFAPVRNLSGHGLELFEIHSEPNIPNYNSGEQAKLQNRQLIAIEPFATDGSGIVQDSNYSTLFSLVERKPVRMEGTRKILDFIEKNYGKMVFTKRWLRKHFKPIEIEFALRELQKFDIIRAYPPLGERSHGMVSQAEHTIIVNEKPLILTN